MRNLMLVLLLSPLLWAQPGLVGKVQLTGGTVVRVTNHVVALSWNACTGAISYNVYRGAYMAGPTRKSSWGLPRAVRSIRMRSTARLIYYVVATVNSQGESGDSSETIVTIP
jgi:hypothetical protein